MAAARTYGEGLVMHWLRTGVPITLVADLADPRGPDSRAIMAQEAIMADVLDAERQAVIAGAARRRQA